MTHRAGCCSCGAGIESRSDTKCTGECRGIVQSILGQYLKQAMTFSTRPLPIIHPQIILSYWLTAQLLRMRDLRFTPSSRGELWAWETLRCTASRLRFVRNVRTRHPATQRNNPVTAISHIQQFRQTTHSTTGLVHVARSAHIWRHAIPHTTSHISPGLAVQLSCFLIKRQLLITFIALVYSVSINIINTTSDLWSYFNSSNIRAAYLPPSRRTPLACSLI
jgi:hypothetical protein